MPAMRPGRPGLAPSIRAWAPGQSPGRRRGAAPRWLAPCCRCYAWAWCQKGVPSTGVLGWAASCALMAPAWCAARPALTAPAKAAAIATGSWARATAVLALFHRLAGVRGPAQPGIDQHRHVQPFAQHLHRIGVDRAAPGAYGG